MVSIQDSLNQAGQRYGQTRPYYNPTAQPSRAPTPTPATRTSLSSAVEGGQGLLAGAGKLFSSLTPDFIENPLKGGLKWGAEKLNQALYSDVGSKIGNVAMSVPRVFSGALKSGEARELSAGRDTRFIPTAKDWQAGLSTALFPSESGIQDPWSAGFLGPGGVYEQRAQFKELSPEEKAIGFVGELAFPTALDFGASKLVTAPLKAAGKAVSGPLGDLARKTPALYKTAEFFDPFFRNPELGKLATTAQRGTRVELNKLYKRIAGLAEDLTPAEQRTVGRLVEKLPVEGENYAAVTTKLTGIADEVTRMGDEIGQQLVERNLLPKESFDKYQGQYMKHIWNSTKDSPLGAKDAIPGFQPFKKRTGAKGYVEEFAAPTYQGLGQGIQNIEADKFYRQVAEDFGVKVSDLADEDIIRLDSQGYVMASQADIPNFRGGEYLSDYMLPDEVVSYIKKTAPATQASNAFVKVLNGVYDFWRSGKTIWNPAYHVRNLISNQFLQNLAKGEPLIKTVVDWGESVANYFGRGNQIYADAAENLGLIRMRTVNQGFDTLLDSAGLMDKNIFKRADDFARNFQNVSEETSKLAVFKHVVDDEAARLGMSTTEALSDLKVTTKAMDVAEEAIFSPYRLGPAEKDFMKWLVPFYSFTRQATPFIVKTAFEHPERFAKYPRFKAAIESFSTDLVPDEDRADWQRGAIQLPVKYEGQPLALDTNYLYPWGNLGEGLDITRGQLPFGLSMNPLATYGIEAITGQELYFDKKFGQGPLKGFSLRDYLNANPRQSGTQYVDHFMRTWAPTLYRNIKGKIYPAYTGQKDYVGRDRSKLMAILDSALGLKIHILDPETKKQFDAWDIKKQLSELEKEMYSIQRDQRLSSEDKRFYLDQARQRFEEILTGKTGK